VPIESVLLPAVAAVAGMGVLRAVPVGLLLIPALAAVAWFLGRTLSTELRLAGSATPPSSADRAAVLIQALVAAFGAFIGIAILVPDRAAQRNRRRHSGCLDRRSGGPRRC